MTLTKEETKELYNLVDIIHNLDCFGNDDLFRESKLLSKASNAQIRRFPKWVRMGLGININDL